MSTPTRTPTLRVEKLSKQFPGVLALDAVSLEVQPGEVHVLLGENGAGKSTLIKILSGVYTPTSGGVVLDGVRASFRSPREAQEAGVRTVFQELSLVPTLTVAENLFLGALPGKAGFYSRSKLPAMARAALDRVDVDIPLHAVVGSLPRSSQQLVEIAKGLLGKARLLILDEPTSSLGEHESERLLAIVKRVAEQGVAVIYITHRLREIAQVGHRVTVLRDGQRVGSVGPGDIGDSDHLVELMTGRRPDTLYPRSPREPGADTLVLRSVSSADLHGVDLVARRGEIVGIAGLLGSGKSSVGRVCVGLDRRVAGDVVVNGRSIRNPTPHSSIRHGVVYYPPDRRRQGLSLLRPLYANITLGSLASAKAAVAGLFVNRRRELQVSREHVERVNIRPADVHRRTELFSGGNQQKAMLARGILHDADVHIFDEPTVGIDVNAKADVYRIMNDLATSGKAVVLVSSDLPEVLGMADRVYVMHEGRVSAHLVGEEITERGVLEHFFASNDERTARA